jgi:hypothetical protein
MRRREKRGERRTPAVEALDQRAEVGAVLVTILPATHIIAPSTKAAVVIAMALRRRLNAVAVCLGQRRI